MRGDNAVVLTFLQKNWFILGILTTVVLGFAVPEGGPLLNRGSVAANALVVVLFLISGFTLPSERVVEGIKEFRLHIFIQLFIFVLIPLYFLVVVALFRAHIDERFIVGIYALSCLPTTVSSCIVFTQLSGGNVVGTMFNASIANIAGVLVSPLLLSLLLREGGHGLPAEEMLRVFRNLALKMLLPIAVGQALRFFLREFSVTHKKKFGVASNVCILFVIYFALASAAQNSMFRDSLRLMPMPFILLAVSHIVLVAIAFGGAKLLGYSRENIISVVFAAPQKTLAMGVPLLSTYFAQDLGMLGVAMLPLLFYHPWQLLIAGFIRSLLSGSAVRAERKGATQ